MEEERAVLLQNWISLGPQNEQRTLKLSEISARSPALRTKESTKVLLLE